MNPIRIGCWLLIAGLLSLAVTIWWWLRPPVDDRAWRLAEVEKEIAAGRLDRAEEILNPILAADADRAEDANQMRSQWLYARLLRLSGRSQDAWVALRRAM